ncbi:MAG: hypothetical protein ACJAWV_000010 [Flammeovirgaceae bacterium]|jgi:hypothetical protein
MNHHIVKTLFLSLAILIWGNVSAQKSLKYKDIFEILQNGTPIEGFQALKEFQEQNPKGEPNVYYQLGKTCQKFMREYDALKETGDVAFFSRHAKIYFELCNANLTKDGFNSTRPYYEDIKPQEGKNKIQLEDITAEIKNRLEDVILFRENHAKMVEHFNGMLENYNVCLEVFMEINQKNAKLKDLHLTSDVSFLKRLDILQNRYSSAISHYASYKEVIDNYSIGDYHQEADIRPIETYRLQGLNPSNFLKNEVEVWNFGKWVSDFRQKQSEEIIPLRNEIVATNQKLNASIRELRSSTSYSDDFAFYKVPNAVLFKIGKYHYQSPIVDLFNFKESQARLFTWSREEVNNPSKEVLESVKGKFLLKLIALKKEADSLNLVAKKSFSISDFEKYPDFLKKEFTDLAGLQSYLQQEEKESDKVLANAIQQWKPWLLLAEKQATLPDTATLRRKSIPVFRNQDEINWNNLSLNKFDTAQSNQYYISSVSTQSNKYFWVSGFYKKLGKVPYPVVAKIYDADTAKYIEKLLEFPHRDTISKSFPFVERMNNGAILLKTDLLDTLQHTLVQVDSLGKIIQTDSVKDIHDVPVLMQYDELNEQVLLGFKGKADDYTYAEYEPFTLKLQSKLGKEIWQTSFDLKGEVVEVLKSNRQWLVLGNYSEIEIENENGVVAFAPKNQTGTFIAFISEKGELEKMMTYPKESGISLFRGIKLDSENIILLGIKTSGLVKSAVYQSDESLYFGLVDSEGNLVFENE